MGTLVSMVGTWWGWNGWCDVGWVGILPLCSSNKAAVILCNQCTVFQLQLLCMCAVYKVCDVYCVVMQ